MNYRPITDFWFLTRAKLKGGVKFYGAYLGGFPERARVLIGCSISDPVLHVCGGMARLYPYKGGFGPNDETLDLDPATQPDHLQDAQDPLPPVMDRDMPWSGMILDPPYSVEDAVHYQPGPERYPRPGPLVQNAINALPVGRRAGLLHYALPKCPKNAKFIACVGVACGFGNRLRCFSVFERLL